MVVPVSPAQDRTTVLASLNRAITAATSHSSTPDNLRAHLTTSLGTLSNAFSRSTNAEIFPLGKMLLLHLSYYEDGIRGTFPWHEAKLHGVYSGLLPDSGFQHSFVQLHGLVQQLDTPV